MSDFGVEKRLDSNLVCASPNGDSLFDSLDFFLHSSFVPTLSYLSTDCSMSCSMHVRDGMMAARGAPFSSVLLRQSLAPSPILFYAKQGVLY